MPAKIYDEIQLESPPSPPVDYSASNGSMAEEIVSPPASPLSDVDVVVSGMSGRLPESDNIKEFRDNLMDGVDMVTENDRRWPPGMYGLPTRGGKLKDLTKFDASFFGVHGKQANSMDPQLRMLLEVTYEAITDAGVNPASVQGSRTGVFIGCSASESHDAWVADMEGVVGYEMTGCTRSMFANRLSFFFDFKGPSYAIDTACSSSLLALHQAIQAIRRDECEAAIVGGCNLCLYPATTLQFQKLGMLSPDGACKSFDVSGNGYVRSEAVMAIYLQRAPQAKRIYATMIHSKTNTDGNKSQGITFPSGAVQKQLLQSVYREAGVDPAAVSYVEAHGTGTKAGDPQEVNTIADVFCRKGRHGPLLIGSTKSNMGHPEPASGLTALAKVLIAMEEQQVPPNLHYTSPNLDIPALSDGRLQVVTKPTAWDGGYAAINSFGFGGANVHVLLKGHTVSSQQIKHPAAKMPRLITFSGRSEEGVEKTLKEMDPQDVNGQFLLQECANTPLSTHPFRGFSLLNQPNAVPDVTKAESGSSGPVWFVFAGMGTQWHGMGRDLMTLDVFYQSIEKSAAVLAPHGVQLKKLIMDAPPEVFEDIVNSFVGIAAIQVALVDVLSSLHIKPSGIVGHSVGELGCAYADGGLTAEETVLAAYWRGRCVKESNLPAGGMAAVGLTWAEAKIRCPEGVVPACHNSIDTVTISGPKQDVHDFVEQLRSEGVFAKEVNSAGVAFHSYYMSRTAPALKKALVRVIADPRRRRSDRWVSSSIPANMADSELARYSSPDYHVNNLLSPVLFQEALEKVPRDAVVIEIAPHCLLQAVLKRSLGKEGTFVGLMKRAHADNMQFFLNSLGKLYQAGVDFNPLLLHKATTLPVPRGTSMLSSMVSWDHSQSWEVPTLDQLMVGDGGGSGASCSYEIDASDPEAADHYMRGHKIDGRVLFPATGYLMLAWRTLAKLAAKTWTEMPVTFEDVAIHRATIMPSDGKLKFDVTISPGTGHFEVCENGGLVVSGRVYQPEAPYTVPAEDDASEKEGIQLSSRDIYKELRLRGYDYGSSFQGLHTTSNAGDSGELCWHDNWVTFLDAMMQLQILTNPAPTLCLPTRIKALRINPQQQARSTVETDQDITIIPARVDQDLGMVMAGGVEMHGLHATVAPRRPPQHSDPVLERYSFVPYMAPTVAIETEALSQYKRCCESEVARIAKQWQMPIDQVSVENENPPEEAAGQKCILLKLLQELGQLENQSDARELISSQVDLSDDCLYSQLLTAPSLKCSLDIITENMNSVQVKMLEVNTNSGHMYKHVVPQLASVPRLQVQYTATGQNLDENVLEEQGVKAAGNWDLSGAEVPGPLKSSADVVLVNNTLHAQPCLQSALEQLKSALRVGGFLLVKEITRNFALPKLLYTLTDGIVATDSRTDGPFCSEEAWRAAFEEAGLEVVACHNDNIMSSLFLCRAVVVETEATVIRCDSFEYEWVEQLKKELEEESERRVWLVSADSNTGLVGMAKCVRQEPGGHRIRCIVGACENALKEVQKADLVMNIYSAGEWGSYRHISLPEAVPLTRTQNAYVNVRTRGDLASLAWIQAKQHEPGTGRSMCNVNYTSLNFRDVMLATGKLPPDAIPGGLAASDCLLGMEFSGVEQETGKRVMGLLEAKGLATSVSVHPEYLWQVPDDWTLEQAASVPVVYATAYYALVVRGRLRQGDSVLIHSGSGGVGQAAIAIALSYGCRVFTTVGSAAKREYLMGRFPQLTADCFANSRDVSFERHILKATHGRGVDVILNSLAEDKLQASVRLLAQHGRFLEIGKVDLANNNSLGMAVFLKNITFHGILLDALFESGSRDWVDVADLVSAGLKNGVIQPLQTTVFERDSVEDAFRFMAQGKHIGKVLIQVSPDSTVAESVLALPRTYCSPHHTYIITGGLGGFGLELASWLVDRGARYLVLTSRAGVRNGYQERRLRGWRRAGVRVEVSRRNVASADDAQALIEETEKEVAPVGGVFHLAMVLNDGFLSNQTAESFARVGDAKVTGTMNLDAACRKVCPDTCRWFVVFSSVVSGHGNAGQTNYGFANAFMERVCEQRQRDGLPGLAVQWGAIGDVGVVQDNFGGEDVVVGGTLPQRIVSCLATLDRFLNQSEPVLSSYVLAEKKTKSLGGAGGGKRLVDTVAHILGLKDPSSIPADVSLGDLGLDSLMGVEVKQAVERATDLILPVSDIRTLTFRRLTEIDGGGSSTREESTADAESSAISEKLDDWTPEQTLVTLKEGKGETYFLVHPIEGSVQHLTEICSHLNGNIYGLQCSKHVPVSSVPDMAAFYIKVLQQQQESGPYHLVGYSFGGCVAFEMALQLQQASSTVQLTLLDASHIFVAVVTEQRRGTDIENQAEALAAFVLRFSPSTDHRRLIESLATFPDFDSRLNHIAELLQAAGDAEQIKQAAKLFYRRLLIAAEYKPSAQLQAANITLIKAEHATNEAEKLGDHYGLQNVVEGDVDVFTVPGDHFSFVRNAGARLIASILEGKYEEIPTQATVVNRGD